MAKPIPVPGPVPGAQAMRMKGTRKKTLSVPKSTAVILAIPQKAADQGVTYAQVIAKAKQEVNLQELGIENPNLESQIDAIANRTWDLLIQQL